MRSRTISTFSVWANLEVSIAGVERTFHAAAAGAAGGACAELPCTMQTLRAAKRKARRIMGVAPGNRRNGIASLQRRQVPYKEQAATTGMAALAAIPCGISPG